MDRERWARLRELFDATRDLDADGRRAHLDSAGVDSGMRHAVESLILHEQTESDTLERIVSDAVRDAPAAAPEQIGPYRIVQRIGEGGMGEVYEADQEHPVRRKVALKLIKVGMDTRQVVARFESERQALALMNHTHIAQVYDAGATPEGRPYFAMEYVKGVSIVDYCDTHKLTNRQRIRLFMQVCEGVQHAHQKGIIHRDLKPSNVIVTIEGDRPLPKIIDFGVAKAVDRRLTERTLHTELGMMIGTPEYMSPEQAEMTGLDIDTRTDVYALGVLLYELLVGARPFEADTSPSSLDEIRRRIREEEPTRPSTRLTVPGDAATDVARKRGTDPEGLRRDLRGDLDWIVLKALEKDRTRRYGSPAELAADLKRHLDNEPVLAGPPSTSYRVGKFVRRHRAGVAMAATLVLLLLGFGVTMAWQAARLARERDAVQVERATAEQVSDFMVGLFATSSPGEALGAEITAREVLDAGAERIRTELSGQPQVQVRLMSKMGEVYADLALYDEARALLEEAVALARREYGNDSVETARAIQHLGMAEGQAMAHDRSESLIREAIEILEGGPGSESHPLLRAQLAESLAVAKIGKAEPDEAVRLYREALDRYAALDTPLPTENVAATRTDLGAALHMADDFEAAEVELREGLKLAYSVLDPDHPTIVDATLDLATLLHDKREYEEAETLYREALDKARRIMGETHPRVADVMVSLGRLLRDRDDFAGAEVILRETLRIDRRAYGDVHENVAYDLKELGNLLRVQDEFAEAEPLFREAIAMYRKVVAPDNPHLAVAIRGLATTLYEDGRFAEALPHIREAAGIFAEALPEDHWLNFVARSDEGEILVRLGRYREGESLLIDSYERIEQRFGSEDPNAVKTRERIVGLYERWGKPDAVATWRARNSSAASTD